MYRTPFLHVSYFYIIRVSLFSLCLEEIFSLKCYNIENSTPSESFFCKDRYLHGYLNEKYLKLAKFDDFEFKFVHFVLFWDQHWFYYPLFWLQATDWTILHEEKVHIQWIHMNKFYVYVLVLSFCHFIRNKQLLYPICYCFSVFWVGVRPPNSWHYKLFDLYFCQDPIILFMVLLFWWVKTKNSPQVGRCDFTVNCLREVISLSMKE